MPHPIRVGPRSSPLSVEGDGVFPDADAFCARLERHPLFTADGPIVVGRAPGRLDVLGGIADYSGSLVVTLPLEAAALAAAQRTGDGRVVAVSGRRRVELAAEELVAPFGRLVRRFSGPDRWAAYALGPLALLAREEDVEPSGFRLLISSSVPEGKGLGSSAAVEVASLTAVAGCSGIELEPRRLALLGQKAEQVFAGAPCGPMDQMTAACGVAGELLLLLCRPAETVGSMPLPIPLTVWGIESGVRHDVAGNRYRRARCAAFMGKALLGFDVEYLAELHPADVDPDRLPQQLLGADYLRRFGGVDDPVGDVEADATYPVRAATLFPLEEQARVARFADLAARPFDPERALVLGRLMLESHEAYSRCGLGTEQTDALVREVVDAGWERGLAGARVCGGGGGGTVVVVGREDAEPVVEAIARRHGAGLVGGSSAGAAGFGVRALVPAAAR